MPFFRLEGVGVGVAGPGVLVGLAVMVAMVFRGAVVLTPAVAPAAPAVVTAAGALVEPHTSQSMVGSEPGALVFMAGVGVGVAVDTGATDWNGRLLLPTVSWLPSEISSGGI